MLLQGGWTALEISASCPHGNCAVSTSVTPPLRLPQPLSPVTSYLSATLCSASTGACPGVLHATLNQDNGALYTTAYHPYLRGVRGVSDNANIEVRLVSATDSLLVGGHSGARNMTFVTAVRTCAIVYVVDQRVCDGAHMIERM